MELVPTLGASIILYFINDDVVLLWKQCRLLLCVHCVYLF